MTFETPQQITSLRLAYTSFSVVVLVAVVAARTSPP